MYLCVVGGGGFFFGAGIGFGLAIINCWGPATL